MNGMVVRTMSGLHELELGGPLWRSFVAGRREATAFHDPAWAGLLAEWYGYRPFALAVLDDQGEPLAGLPFLETTTMRRTRSWVSLPFTDMCEPLSIATGLARSAVAGVIRHSPPFVCRAVGASFYKYA